MKPDNNPNGKYEPNFYLGAKFKKVQTINGVWGYLLLLSPSKYVTENIRLVEEYLSEHYGEKLNTSSKQRGSAPSLMDTEQKRICWRNCLWKKRHGYYQSQTGILRCMVELGRIDIITEVSMLSSYLALPRRGH
jgi:hypothetical protein